MKEITPLSNLLDDMGFLSFDSTVDEPEGLADELPMLVEDVAVEDVVLDGRLVG